MKPIFKYLLPAFLLLWLFPARIVASSSPATVEIQVNLNIDGSVDVVETRPYQFANTSSFNTYYLPTVADGKVLSDVQLAILGNPLFPAKTEMQAGTFVAPLLPNADYRFLPFAAGSAALTVTYHVTNAALRYRDAVVSDLELVSSAWPDKANLHVLINLPRQISDWSWEMFVHTRASNIQSTLADPQTLNLSLSALQAKTAVNIETILPSDLLDTALIDKSVKADLIHTETIYQSNAKAQQENNSKLSRLLLIYLAIAQPLMLIVWLLLYFQLRLKLRSKYYFRSPPTYAEQPPEMLSPALTSAFYEPDLFCAPNALTATIFDLARRGFIKLEIEKQVTSGILGSTHKYKTYLQRMDLADHSDKLLNFEKTTLALLFKSADGLMDANKIALDQLATHFKQTTFTTLYHHFEDEVKSAATSHRIIDMEFSRSEQRLWLLSGGLILLGSPTILIALILTPALRKRLPNKSKMLGLLQAYRHFLNDFASFDEVPATLTEHWEKHLAYAIALGAKKSLLKTLPDIFQSSPVQPSWFHLAGESHFNTAVLGSINFSFDAIIATIEKAIPAPQDCLKAQ